MTIHMPARMTEAFEESTTSGRQQDVGSNSGCLQADAVRIIERLNTQHRADIQSIARFYGKSPLAQNALVSGLEKHALSIEWELLAEDAVRKQSVHLAISNAALVIDQVEELAGNARIALAALELAKRRPEDMLPVPIVFALPPLPVSAAVVGGLAMLTCLAFFAQPDSVLAGLVFPTLPQYYFYVAFTILAALHSAEALVMFLACRFLQRLKNEYRLSDSTRLKYALSTLVFGVFAGVMLTRQALKDHGYRVK
ncbi:hypothetical protein GGI04_005645, partial [Coemansia thaxteri]